MKFVIIDKNFNMYLYKTHANHDNTLVYEMGLYPQSAKDFETREDAESYIEQLENPNWWFAMELNPK